MKKILRSIRNKPATSFTLFLCVTITLLIIALLNIKDIFYMFLLPFITYYVNKIVYITLFEIKY